jgi:hypothetical protein
MRERESESKHERERERCGATPVIPSTQEAEAGGVKV